MTKSEYLSALKHKLESFNMELQQEIMEDYEQHFAEGLAAGKTEDEIIEELGSIEDMIQELPEEDMKQEIQAMDNVSRKNSTYEGEYKAIAIEGLVADVYLEGSDDGCISVDYQNDGDAYIQQKYRFYQYEENGVFHVGVKDSGERKDKKKIVLFGKTILSYNSMTQCNGNIQLTVRIPAGIPRVEAVTLSGDLDVRGVRTNQLELKTTSGDMNLDDMESAGMSFQTASGDIDLTGARAETVRMQTASGDIEVSDLTAATLTAGTGSGDMEIEGSLEEYIIKTGSGDVELKAESGVRRINVTTGSGDAELDLTRAGGAEVHATVGSGDCAIYGADGEQHQVTCGSITVGNGDCKVSVRTGSGDVEVRC